MGQNHVPTELEIIEFIYSMDKNNDGKLSRIELENAFKRANRIEYWWVSTTFITFFITKNNQKIESTWAYYSF